MNNWILILSVLVSIYSIFTIIKDREMAWVIIKAVGFILFAVIGYWLFTPKEHDRYFNNLCLKWFPTTKSKEEEK